MRLQMWDTISESLGFAFKEFETILRVTFLPICLTLLFMSVLPFVIMSLMQGTSITINNPNVFTAYQEYVGMIKGLKGKNMVQALFEKWEVTFAYILLPQLFLMFMISTFYIPLQRYAALGTVPARGWINLYVGKHTLIFLLAAVLASGMFLLIEFLVFLRPMTSLMTFIQSSFSTFDFSFSNSDSLHQFDRVARVEKEDQGLYLSLPLLLKYLSFIVMGYLMLRLYPVPAFIAARDGESVGSNVRSALSVSKGVDVFNLLGVLVVLGLTIFLLQTVMFKWALPLIISALRVIYSFVTSTQGLVEEPTGTALMVALWALTFVRFTLIMALMMFQVGIVAGLGGSLYNRFARN